MSTIKPKSIWVYITLMLSIKPKPNSFSSVDSYKTSDLRFSNANLSLSSLLCLFLSLFKWITPSYLIFVSPPFLTNDLNSQKQVPQIWPWWPKFVLQFTTIGMLMLSLVVWWLCWCDILSVVWNFVELRNPIFM